MTKWRFSGETLMSHWLTKGDENVIARLVRAIQKHQKLDSPNKSGNDRIIVNQWRMVHFRGKMVLFLICNFYLLSLMFYLSPSYADTYEWLDENGVVNFSDDIMNVPPQYRDRVKIHKQKRAVVKPPSKEKTGDISQQPKTELFGGYPLEWWKTQFEEKRKKISETEKTISDQKRYIEIYQKGRRVGQIYSKEEADVYDDYVKQLPLNGNKLEGLKKELEGFKKKAFQQGVPHFVRE